MRTSLLVGSLAALLITNLGTNAGAQPAPQPSGGHRMHLTKLPNGDYTVPLAELEASGASGRVIVHPQGLKTLVTISVSGKPRHRHVFSLHSGRDCGIHGTAASIALTPALTGQASRTIVSLPIDALTSKDYVVTAQDATARQQFREACARL